MIAARNMNHIKFLNAYIKFILDLKTEIKYNQEPILKIFEKYSRSSVLSPMLEKCLKLSQSLPISQAWSAAFSNLHRAIGVSQEEEKIIKDFARNLGQTDILSQLNYCEYNISIIKPYLNEALENKKKNEQLPIILGVCLSLIISTLMI